MTGEEDRVWTFFRNEQKINKHLREEVKALNRRLKIIGNLERSVRDMEIENTRLRAEVKRLLAICAALGEEA